MAKGFFLDDCQMLIFISGLDQLADQRQLAARNWLFRAMQLRQQSTKDLDTLREDLVTFKITAPIDDARKIHSYDTSIGTVEKI